MNVIFLDIDGVMNSNDLYHRIHKTIRKRIIRLFNVTIRSYIRWILTGSKYYSSTKFKPNPKHKTFEYRFNRLKEETDPIKWEWLSEFCNRTGTKICISSCWKWHFDGNANENNERWDKAFSKLGFNEDTFVGITGDRRTYRGQEIKEWIDNVNSDLSTTPHVIDRVDKYAIIDDDSDMLPEQLVSFFHVDEWYGLSPNTLYRIGRHFNK